MGVILEPKVREETLHYHHGDAHKEGIGDAKLCLEIETIIGKQSATDDRGNSWSDSFYQTGAGTTIPF